MNAYLTLDLLKNASVLDITGTGDDARLRGALENVSRQIDRYCNRHFYTAALTQTFDGTGTQRLFVPDLIAVTALKTDDNLDRTFETTWAATDYLLLPSNADPATAGNQNSRPYTQVLVDLDAGTKADWPFGVQMVEIDGDWGWWKHLATATEVTDEALDASEVGVDVDTRTDIEAGHTILIDSEQMYIKSYSSNTLTVVRGVNGTTAATHDTATAISIYEYPGPIIESVLIQTARLWKRKDSAFANTVGFPDGTMQVFSGLDSDVKMLLSPYRKTPI